uniref:Uncharacterized protein n=1 Tax=Lepeophtheirus salmonis TaxID=72036 RepID=A0A0K2VEV1_LEPSM
MGDLRGYDESVKKKKKHTHTIDSSLNNCDIRLICCCSSSFKITSR